MSDLSSNDKKITCCQYVSESTPRQKYATCNDIAKCLDPVAGFKLVGQYLVDDCKDCVAPDSNFIIKKPSSSIFRKKNIE